MVRKCVGARAIGFVSCESMYVALMVVTLGRCGGAKDLHPRDAAPSAMCTLRSVMMAGFDLYQHCPDFWRMTGKYPL